MAFADTIGTTSVGGFSSVVGRTGFGDGLTYEGGQGGRPAVVSGPVSARPGGPSIEANAVVAPTVRAWLKGFGFGSHTGADAFGPAITVRGGGAAAGIERFVTPSLLIGAAVGFTGSRTESTVLHSDADAVSGAVYASWLASAGFEADALLGINQTRFRNARMLTIGALPVATQGDTDAPGFNAAGDIGYRIPLGNAAAAAYLKPFAGVNYAETDRRAYTEAAVSLPGASLAFPGQSFRRFASLAGADAGITTSWVDGISVRPEVRLAWVHDFIDPSPVVNATFVAPPAAIPFATRDPEPGRDGLVVGALLTAWRSAGFQVFASYAGEFRSNSQTHLGTAGFRVSW